MQRVRRVRQGLPGGRCRTSTRWGLSSRKAIYIPFPQAVPCSYILNMDDCLGNNPIACGKCAEVCEKEAINYDDQDEIVTREVGAIIVAIGLDVYDPTEMDEYGYTRFDNVITSMEFERLICAGGPTAGTSCAPRTSERPKRIGFIQCVGSRNPKIGRPYCSNICCMNTIKDTLLLADHYPDIENSVFYQDIRAFGKSLRGHVPALQGGGHPLHPRAAGRHRGGSGDRQPRSSRSRTRPRGKLERHELDMVVLSVGVEPPKDLRQDLQPADAVQDLRRLLHGVASQAEAGGRADAGRLLRRLLRVAEGHQGLGLPGGRGGVPRRCAAQRRARSRSRRSPA